ncbi:retrovirus-related pol polyprotein from transposon TNT 1-94 [Tanacetum coccineum]
MVPNEVLMRSGLVSLNTPRPVNTAQPKTTVNSARPMKTVFNKAHSTVRRPINNKTTTKNSNFNKRVNIISGKNVNTTRPKVVVNIVKLKAVLNAVKGNQVNDVKASVWNMSFLTDFEEIDGGYFTFEGNPKGGKITDRDDYSRFSWVFFLANKDETSGILKSFITGVENLIDQRVKVIRCDNGTEFKNKEMNQFCKRKGTKASDDAGKARMETVPGKDYILLPLWPVDPLLSQISKSSLDAGFKPLRDNKKKVTEEPRKEGGDSSNDQENSTVNAAGIEVNVVGAKTSIELLDDPNMPKKEDNVNNTNNVNTVSNGNGTNNINVVSSTVNVAGIEVNVVGAKKSIKLPDDPNMPEFEDIVYLDDAEDVGAEADMNNLNTFILVSPILTTRIHKDHPVEQIIGDLNSAPQTRRMTKNLEEHGYTQEEGIDYDEVFAPVARIEAIRLFLAYASFKDFVVYQMDVKSAFLYGKIEEEVYVYQPPGFEDPDFPDRVYKVEKTLYGLHQAPKACQDKYVTEILKKFAFTDVKTASTPMETQKPLLKDEDGEEVGIHLYRSMIGSLMNLTYSRPDIMFALCACARYQVNPKVSHLHVVKRIFRYGSVKNHKKIVKNRQTRARESEEYKAEARKVKPQSNHGQKKSTRPKIFHLSPSSFTKSKNSHSPLNGPYPDL